jgi:hypothetical protein
MVATLAWILGERAGQPRHLNLAAQGIDDPEHPF